MREERAPSRGERCVTALGRLWLLAVVSLGAAPAARGIVTIDFEDLNAPGNGTGGLVVANQYAGLGVTFNFPRALDYSQGTPVLPGFAHSGTKAIELCYGFEFCTAPLELRFTAAQQRVKLWVGYASRLDAPQLVVLRGFDATGAEVGQASTTLDPSAAAIPIATPLEVALGGPAIVRATLGFAGAEQPNPSVFNDDLAVDDVEFDTQGPQPPCPTTQPPQLTVHAPADGFATFDNAFNLDVNVTTPDPFATLRVDGTSAGGTTRQFGPVFINGGRVVLNGITGFLSEGKNTLAIAVQDCAGSASATRTVFYKPQTHVEVNQAVQDLDNGVPLFLGKRTLVRVFANTASTTWLSAALFDVNDSATPVWGPIEVGPVDLPAVVSRDRLQDSINFELPSLGWRAGHEYLLRTTLLRPLATPLVEEMRLKFYDSVPLALMPIWETRVDDGARVSAETFSAAVRRLNVLYPVGRILVRDINLTVPEDRASWSWFGTLRLLASASDALFARLGVEPPMCSSCYWAAVRTDCSPFWCGLAGLNELTSISTLTAGDTEGGTYILAQEIGHNLGRMHASNAHGEDDGGGHDTAYPYPHGEISDDVTYRMLSNATSRGRHHGVDPGTNPVRTDPWWLIPPHTPDGLDHRHDYMSYGAGADIWTSAYTHNALSCANRSGRFDSYYGRAAAVPAGALPPPSVCTAPSALGATGTAARSASEPLALVPAVVVGGVIRGRSVEFAPSYVAHVPADPRLYEAGSGDVLVQLEDATGGVLVQRAFSALSHPEGGDIEFSQTLPWDDRVARITLRERLDPNHELGHLKRRNGLPRARFRSLPRSLHKRPGTVTWTTYHPDGEGGLVSTLMFSPGQGKPWRILAANLTETRHRLDPDVLPGARGGRLRLVVSDGIQTTSIDSSPVIDIPAKPPLVTIVQPADGARVAGGTRLILEASATSPQHGTLPEDAFEWSSAGRLLGRGSRIEARGLSAGRHAIRVVVTDSDGLAAERQVRVDLDPSSVPVLGDAPGTTFPSIAPADGAGAPEIAGLSADPSVLWPPNHKMVPVTVSYDLLGDADASERACRLDVTSNEDVGAGAQAAGSADWQTLDAHHVLLRAERDGDDASRVYTIGVTCADRRGDTARGRVTVTVPHSNGASGSP